MALRSLLALGIHLQWFAEDTPVSDPKPQQDPGPADPGKGPSEELPEWMVDLPDPLKSSKSLQRYADKATLAAGYVELERKLSKSVTIPDKDSKPEDWEKYFSRTGRPKTADEYNLTPFIGYKQDPVTDAAFKAAAYREGLSVKAAAALYATFTQRLVEDESARSAQVLRARSTALQELKATWGDKHEANIASARATYLAHFSPASQAALKEAHLEDHPAIVADLAALSALFGEDKIVDGGPPKGPPKEKLATTDPEHPYAYMNGGN